MARADYPLKVLHEYTLAAEEAESLGDWVARNRARPLAALPGVSANRVESMPLTGRLLVELVRAFRPGRVSVSAFGLREGVCLERIDPALRGEDPLLAACRAQERRRARAPGFGAELGPWVLRLLAPEDPEEARLICSPPPCSQMSTGAPIPTIACRAAGRRSRAARSPISAIAGGCSSVPRWSRATAARGRLGPGARAADAAGGGARADRWDRRCASARCWQARHPGCSGAPRLTLDGGLNLALSGRPRPWPERTWTSVSPCSPGRWVSSQSWRRRDPGGRRQRAGPPPPPRSAPHRHPSGPPVRPAAHGRAWRWPAGAHPAVPQGGWLLHETRLSRVPRCRGRSRAAPDARGGSRPRAARHGPDPARFRVPMPPGGQGAADRAMPVSACPLAPRPRGRAVSVPARRHRHRTSCRGRAATGARAAGARAAPAPSGWAGPPPATRRAVSRVGEGAGAP